MDEDGFPLSWRHYVYGMGHLMRANARRQMEMASAFRVAQAEKKDYGEWRRELRAFTK